jgi:hypothetical protein
VYLNELAEHKQINEITDTMFDDDLDCFYAAETLVNDLNHDSFFMLRGESVIMSNSMMVDSSMNLDYNID